MIETLEECRTLGIYFIFISIIIGAVIGFVTGIKCK